MYEHDGEQYFVVDGHVHFWNAAPDNWVAGQEEYAKGWIDCFFAYHGLSPADTHWPYEQFRRYDAELMMRHLFDEGHVDVAIFQPTYLSQWYVEGFNTTNVRAARRAAPRQVHPERRMGPSRRRRRSGRSSRPRWSGTDSKERSCTPLSGAATREAGASRATRLRGYLELCERLGVRNIHVHKGPTIWPLDKDAFDVPTSTSLRRTSQG
jgi:predicted TIM-barrel fold metal-dependent hydrolase